VIVFSFLGVPPSTNNVYFNLPKGGRVLNAAGKKYKTEISTTIVRQHQAEIRDIQLNHPYGILFVVSMNILNAGWPEKAKTRYKKLDASNRVKLLEDAIVEALGIDDSQVIISVVVKRHAETEVTDVVIWDYEMEQVDAALKRVGVR
jgi:Holliday junction resolvase RusA-like endonuclease